MKTILVTGATDGIGLETAKQLAKLGHEIVLHGRNEEKARQTVESILHAAPNAVLHTVHADFADLSDVARMAQGLIARLSRLDVLVNNAGVYMTRRELSKDGFEMTLAVNHLAHFLLANLLLPLLKESAAPRVITVSSVTHMNGRIEFDNLNGERGFDAYQTYSNSKLANALFANELARRETWLASNSLHPGVINTKLLHAAFSMAGASAAEGARTSVYLATSAAVAGVSGKYFTHSEAAIPSLQAQDPYLAQRLWKWSEEAVRPYCLSR